MIPVVEPGGREIPDEEQKAIEKEFNENYERCLMDVIDDREFGPIPSLVIIDVRGPISFIVLIVIQILRGGYTYAQDSLGRRSGRGTEGGLQSHVDASCSPRVAEPVSSDCSKASVPIFMELQIHLGGEASHRCGEGSPRRF